MNISYTFYDRNDRPYDFDLEVEDSKIQNFLETNIGLDQLVKDAQNKFSELSDEDKQKLLNELREVDDELVSGDEPNYPVMLDWDFDWVLESGLIDIEDYMDQISDAWEDEAREDWEDSQVDDYTRYGLSPYDFADPNY